MWRILLLVILVIGVADNKLNNKWPNEPKIIGGKETTIEKYPFAVALLTKEDPFEPMEFQCGGSVISTWHVLTAAHCVTTLIRLVDKNDKFLRFKTETSCPSHIFARVGSTNLYNGGSVHQGSDIVVHPKFYYYKKDAPINDIAVLKLAQPVTYSDKVQPVMLPPQDLTLIDRTKVKICGWGRFGIEGVYSNVLLEAQIYIVNLNKCKYFLRLGLPEEFLNLMDDTMFCAGIFLTGGKDSCQGDSGGPLVDGNVQLGVTSWGNGCGVPFYPGLYTLVPKYINWIMETLQKDNEQPNMLRSSSSQVIPGVIATAVIPSSLMLYQI